ncbi:MAG: hypothetical protein M3401_15660 [Actinomycetota bacterium]|nr:hypothetical protein [Actinomycetota bacterium]
MDRRGDARSTDPEPGRPRALGPDDDLAAAEAILLVLQASRGVLARESPENPRRTGPVRLVREAMWFFWERPRLPRPLVASKYPKTYPWSPGAQAWYETHGGRRPQGGWGLVIEHLYPRELVVNDLLTGEQRDPDAVVALLSTRVMAAIVTRQDDRLLPARGKSPGTWSSYEADPWVRYRSKLQLDGFAALE